MPREVKELMVRDMERMFSEVPQAGCVVVNYRGLNARAGDDVRQGVREGGAQMTVVKNTLFELAMENLGVQGMDGLLAGPVAVITADNPVAAAKAAKQAADASDAVELLGGYVEGAVVPAPQIERLASIPGREELLSQIAGMLLSPLRRLAAGLVQRPREVINVIDQLREQRAGAAEE